MRSELTFACLFVVACSNGGSVDTTQLGTPCQNGACPAGLEPDTFCGFAGCGDGGGQSCSCEIKCAQNASVCPSGTSCVTISDGPGTVCVKN